MGGYNKAVWAASSRKILHLRYSRWKVLSKIFPQEKGPEEGRSACSFACTHSGGGVDVYQVPVNGG